MMATPSWQDAIRVLDELAATLGFARSEIEEKLDDLIYSRSDLPAAPLTLPAEATAADAQLDKLNAVLLAAKETYGSALELKLSLYPKDLRLDDQYDKLKLSAFCNLIPGSPTVELYLKIDKNKLLPNLGFTQPATTFKIFFSHAALQRALSGTLKDLEEGEQPLFKNFTGESKIIILLLDSPIDLNGDYLAILGGDRIAKWSEYCPLASDREQARDRVKNVYDQASNELKRQNVSLDYLTPLQLQVDWKTGKGSSGLEPSKSDLVASLLYAQLFACSVFYIAGESRFGKQPEEADHSWVAIFKADKYLATVDLWDAETNADRLTDQAVNNPFAACLTISDLALWIYSGEEGGVSNRVAVVQAAVASSLEDNKSDDNLQQLALRADEILERVKRLWKQFVGEKLDKYFLHVKELEETVESTTKSYNEHVQSLTTTLTGNMLAAVAVIVGSFLAAIFKSPFDPNVFLFGVGIYLAYLAIFPIGIGLVSAWQRFSDSRDVFKKRKEDFSKRLGDNEVKDIVAKTVSDRETWFKKWFGVTIFLYAVVFILVVVALVTVPNAIKRWSDDFKLAEVAYGEPVNSEAVPVIIRGENFDKEKEIVVSVGHAKFTNTDEQSLKVHGSTVLSFSLNRTDLDAMLKEKKLSLEVRQGASATKTVNLPLNTPAVPLPEFTQFSLMPSGGIVAQGSNFGSIARINFNGVNLKFEVSTDGGKLTIAADSTLKTLPGKAFDMTLRDDRTISIPVTLSP